MHMKSWCLFVMSVLLLAACSRSEFESDQIARDQESMIELFNVPSDFTYEINKDYSIELTFLNSSNNPVEGIVFELFDQNLETLKDQGIVREVDNIYKGISDDSGEAVVNVRLPATQTAVYLRPNAAGFSELIEIELSQKKLSLTLGGPRTKAVTQSSAVGLKALTKNYYEYLYNVDNAGVPIGMGFDELDEMFMPSVEASLPELPRLYETHPEYFGENSLSSVPVTSDTKLYATFVHEGAAYTNSIGYFTYRTNNPPKSVEDIDNFFLIFPNASFEGAGGGLYTGDKVLLKYYDEGSGDFVETFPSGVTVGWFMVSNGWRGFSNGVDDTGREVFYSEDQLNSETDPDKRKHFVTIYDTERQLFLVGIEDLNRETWTDEDFNDAVFYITPESLGSVDVSNASPISEPIDSDKDGVVDYYDDYPKDPDRAIDWYYPSRTGYNTLAFEDLWPKEGDLDFNDMVVDYKLHFVVSGSQELVSSTMDFKLRATGAGYFNGFGVEFPFKASQVESVTGYRITENNVVTMAPNGLEAGQDKAVYIVFDNSYDHLKPIGDFFVNTQSEVGYVTPPEFTLETVFKAGVSRSDLGEKWFNPFVIMNRVRGVELHLPGYPPTQLADKSLFGTEDDITDGVKNFYISKNRVPWALEFSDVFAYPSEHNGIVYAYKHFITWSNSGGTQFTDWMKNLPGYRDESLLYKAPQ